MARPKDLRSRIAAREEVRGVMVKAPSPEIVELCGLAGLDFVVIDSEHGAISPESCTEMVRAAEVRELSALARVPSHEASTTLRYLEIGVVGVHVPSISTAGMLGDAIDGLFHSPQGHRGLAAGRWACWGAAGGLADAVEASARELVVVVHVEDKAGVSAVDELLEESRIDVYFLGPVDLSNDLGFPGQIDRPEVREVCIDTVRRIVAAGRVAGTVIRTPDEIPIWRALGVSYFVGSAESLIVSAIRRFADEELR